MSGTGSLWRCARQPSGSGTTCGICSRPRPRRRGSAPRRPRATRPPAQGISPARSVRDATIMRLGVISGRRGDLEGSLTLQDLAAGAVTGRPANGDDELLRDPARLDALRATGLLDSPP